MAENVKVKFKKLDERAVIPQYAHNGDVGMDVTAISVEYDSSCDMYIYHTGLACETDFGYGIFGFPRSSNSKKECYLTNSVGIIDSAIYRGEIQFRFKNRDKLNISDWSKKVTLEEFALSKAPYAVGDRVGQLVVMPYPRVEIEEVNELSETDRGTGGFGSTGK